MVFEQSEIESVVLEHFSTVFDGKRVPVYADSEPVDQVELALHEIDQLLLGMPQGYKEDEFEEIVCSPFTFNELDSCLEDLPNGKAAGVDNIPNELLKHSSLQSKLYLQTLLNKILQEGEVPPDLNKGKCMLIFKVSIT